jgi:hypothetical protein
MLLHNLVDHNRDSVNALPTLTNGTAVAFKDANRE